MLRDNILKATASLLRQRIRRGIGLEAVEGSPVAELSNLTVPGTLDTLIDVAVNRDSPTPEEVIKAVTKVVSPSEAHGLYMDDLVAEGTAAVMGMIDMARNVVAPAIATTVDNVSQVVSCKVTPQNTVKVYTLDPIATSPTMGDLLASFKEAKSKLDTIPDIPAISGEQYTALLETGNAETNEKLLTYLAKYPAEYLDALVDDLIRGTPSNVCPGYVPFTKYANGRRYLRRSIDTLPALAVACTLLRNLQDNPFEGINASITVWNEQITLTLAGLATAYWALLGQLAAHVASRRLRLPTTLTEGDPVATGEFPILDRTYEQFLEAGGSPDLLFGLSIDTDYYSGTLDQVIADKDRLLISWGRYVETYRMRTMDNMDDVIRIALYGEIGKSLDALDYGELDTTRQEVWEIVKTYCEAVTFSPSTLYTSVRHLYAGVIYRKYGTFDVLAAMDEYAEQYNCEPRIAAYHAAKEYICQWVFKQMIKVKPYGV